MAGPSPREEGFSVIEALVGVAILGIALAPLIELQTGVTRQSQRQAALEEQLVTQRNALVVLRDINVMEEPDGRRELTGGRRLFWTATPLTPDTRSLRFLGGEGNFEVALFEVHAEVREPRRPAIRFSIEQLGWHRLAER